MHTLLIGSMLPSQMCNVFAQFKVTRLSVDYYGKGANIELFIMI